jgi:hypothetical protein
MSAIHDIKKAASSFIQIGSVNNRTSTDVIINNLRTFNMFVIDTMVPLVQLQTNDDKEAIFYSLLDELKERLK